MDSRDQLGALIRRLRTERGWSQSRLAERPAEVSGWPTLTRSEVHRWETGKRKPKAWMPHLAAVFDVSREILEAATVDRGVLMAQMSARPDRAIDPSAPLAVDAALLGPIDTDYVAAIRDSAQHLVALDNHYGGDDIARIAIRAFADAQRHAAGGDVPSDIERDFLAAAAELGEVAGWLLIDADRREAARHVNNEALTLARLAGDRSIELLITQNMSMQAATLGRFPESLRLARHVLDTRKLSPRLRTMFRIREARALSGGGQRTEALRALGHAETLYLDGIRDSDPAWAWWVNDDQMAVQRGLCSADLEDWDHAINWQMRAVEITPSDQPWGQYINLASLLNTTVKAGAWADARTTAEAILPYSTRLGSSRTEAILKTVFERTEHTPPPPSARDAIHNLRELVGRND